MWRFKFLLVLVSAAQVYAHSPALVAISESNAKFSRDLFKIFSNVPGNLVSSPLSAHMALSMTQLGARESTASDMSTALHLPADPTLSKEGFKQLAEALQGANSDAVTVSVLNHMFVKSGFVLERDFLNAAQAAFSAMPVSVDFLNPNTRLTINKWVEDATKNKIKDLVQRDDLNAFTRLVLINAVYFNGKWETQFNPRQTTPQLFYTSPILGRLVPMMQIERSFKYGQLQDLDAQLVELPYKGKKLSMVVILPNSRSGLPELETKMQTSDLSVLVNSATQKYIRVIMPKFKIETSIDLEVPLKQMGMEVIFSPRADFSGITKSELLSVSKVKQKTVIEVTEGGTEAASATQVIMMMRSTPSRPPTMLINHPFLFFLVQHVTNTNLVVLFSGRVVNPHF